MLYIKYRETPDLFKSPLEMYVYPKYQRPVLRLYRCRYECRGRDVFVTCISKVTIYNKSSFHTAIPVLVVYDDSVEKDMRLVLQRNLYSVHL